MCKRWVSSASCNALPLLDALYVRAMLETADLNTDDEDEEDDDDDATTPRATRSMETQPASRRLSRCSIEMKNEDETSLYGGVERTARRRPRRAPKRHTWSRRNFDVKRNAPNARVKRSRVRAVVVVRRRQRMVWVSTQPPVRTKSRMKCRG